MKPYEDNSSGDDLEFQEFFQSRPSLNNKPSMYSIAINYDEDSDNESMVSGSSSLFVAEEIKHVKKVLKPPINFGRQYSTMAMASSSFAFQQGELKNSLLLGNLNSVGVGENESNQSSARSVHTLSEMDREQGVKTLKKAAGFKKGLSSRLHKGLQSSNNLLNALANVNFIQTETEYTGSVANESCMTESCVSDGFDLVSDLEVYGSVMNGYTEKDAPPQQEEAEDLNSAIDQMILCGFPIIIFTENFSIEYLNPEAEKLFGIHSFVALGENLSKYVDEQSIVNIQEEIERFCGSLNSWEITDAHCATHSLPYSLIRKDERSRRRHKLLSRDLKLTCHSNIVKKSFPGNGRLVTMKKCGKIHYCLYIHPCKFSEEEEKQLKNKTIYASITELSVIPIISINQEGVIQVFNESAVNVFGYQKHEVLGKNIKMLCNPSDRRKHDYFLGRYMRTREKSVIDHVRYLKAEGKNGKILSIETRISEVFEPKTQTSHFIGFIRDVGMVATREEQMTKIAERIFPKNIAQRLSMGQKIIDNVPCCTLLYCDIVGFTNFSHGKNPTRVVKILDEIFQQFDILCTSNNLEKIKTIGDCYFLVGGLLEESPTSENKHAEQCVKCGFEMVNSIIKFNEKNALQEGSFTGVRVGIHTARNLTAAVVGKVKQTFDLFGEGVSISSLIESNGKMNRVHISQDTFSLLSSESQQLFEPHLNKLERRQENHSSISINTFLSKQQ